MHGSDEEMDDPPEVGSDDDLSDDDDKGVLEEVWISCLVNNHRPDLQPKI